MIGFQYLIIGFHYMIFSWLCIIVTWLSYSYMFLYVFTSLLHGFYVFTSILHGLHVIMMFLHHYYMDFTCFTWQLHVIFLSQSGQCTWENSLKTIHLDGCCLSTSVWSRINVGSSRGQFQFSEEHRADDGMQWLPQAVWGMEWADSPNTL